GRAMIGFAIAGEDRHFFPANAVFAPVNENRNDEEDDEVKRYDKKLKIWSPLVKKPVAVRYAWARNPLGNVVNEEHYESVIPIPSFRTDEWDWPEAPFSADSDQTKEKFSESRDEMRKNAER
ncbi:MAG: hypothetical protein GY906_35120, partial [bacterium]|nr:hypothetical protein [bacterium]